MRLLWTSEPEIRIDTVIQKIRDPSPQEKYACDKNTPILRESNFFLHEKKNVSKECNQKGQKEESDFHLFETMYEDAGNPENAL